MTKNNRQYKSALSNVRHYTELAAIALASDDMTEAQAQLLTDEAAHWAAIANSLRSN